VSGRWQFLHFAGHSSAVRSQCDLEHVSVPLPRLLKTYYSPPLYMRMSALVYFVTLLFKPPHIHGLTYAWWMFEH
jgi:hypothetical protein